MEQTGDVVSRGVAALKAGNKADALRILRTVVEQDSQNVSGWLWLAASVSTPSETLSCLNRVLALDPQNAKALAGIQWASSELERERSKHPESLPAFQMASLPVVPSDVPGTATSSSVPLSSPEAPEQSALRMAGRPGAAPRSRFAFNVVIAVLSLSLVLGLLIIGGLLYAWLG